MDAEHPDHALIWNLQLLSQVIHKVGSSLHAYADQLLPCLQKCVHLKSKQAFSHASSVCVISTCFEDHPYVMYARATVLCLQAVANILQTLTLMYPLESYSIAGGFDKSPEEHLYIRVRWLEGEGKILDLLLGVCCFSGAGLGGAYGQGQFGFDLVRSLVERPAACGPSPGRVPQTRDGETSFFHGW